MALHNTTTLRHSLHPVIQYLILIVSEVLVAVTMTIIANRFDIRYLCDATILVWIALTVLFCFVSSTVIILRLILAGLSFFVSTGIYSILLFIYKTF